jgi:class 3 adenylate cyclase
VGGYYKIENAPWTLVLLAPGKSVLAPIIRFLFYYVIAGLLSIGIILFLIRFVGGKMVGSIREIAEAADQVAQGKYGRPLAIKTKDEIGRLRYQFNAMVSGLKERDFIRNTFGRYVDHEIAEKLLKRPEASRLGGEKRKVAILMSDIRDFTAITESLDPESVIRMLNHYFSYIIELFRKYRGIIVDFFGDGVLVFFDPLDEPPEPELRAALRCALEVQGAMEQLNAELASKGLPRLSVGIGINVGEVVVGNIGSETRAKYGIVGTAVNMTQRIQSKAKGGEVVISQSVHEHIGKELMTQKPFQTTLKGIQHEMNLYVVDQLLDVS